MTAHPLDQPLVTMPAGTRLCNGLRNAGFKTLREAATADRAELLRIPNFGKKALAELEALLDGAAPIEANPRSVKSRQRCQEILEQRRSGLSYAEIGNKYGITANHAYSLGRSAAFHEYVISYALAERT